ncbi:MAG: Na/Pi cotransporter family protein [Clostridia bacterium]|nr:Na/Pi cotransporter family protein [Clostridia bacterium]
MDFTLLLGLLGGLALFLYGMQMMSDGLEAAAGNRMKRILEKLTSNRFLGVAVGAGITALIQSSSATTVMVVGFVNSGLMTLRQAVWIIMGANIGTTITGQLIALDVGALAPLLAFVGVAMIAFLKKESFHHYGNIIAGLGILFIGMNMMSSSMEPLRESETFVNLVTQFSNPLVGIVVGAVFTAIIQSSSASVGILQALAMSGVIGLPSAVYVLFGQNIGTCITAVLASIGTSRSAKRTTIIHLLFNIIGTTIFTIICMLTPLTAFMQSLTPDNPAAQIANMHTLFNVVTTIILLPFGGYLAQLAAKILPERETEETSEYHLQYIGKLDISNESHLGNSAIATSNIRNELSRMAEMVRENVSYSFSAAIKGIANHSSDIDNTEEYIDYLNKEISKYISGIMAHEANIEETSQLSAYFKIAGNLERIGDHAMNVYGYAGTLSEKNSSFSEKAAGEIAEMQKICMRAIDLIGNIEAVSAERLVEIAAIEQKMDDMTVQYRKNQIERMHNGSCSDEACILYSEMLTDFERIGDHVLNIGEALVTSKK